MHFVVCPRVEELLTLMQLYWVVGGGTTTVKSLIGSWEWYILIIILGVLVIVIIILAIVIYIRKRNAEKNKISASQEHLAKDGKLVFYSSTIFGGLGFNKRWPLLIIPDE